MLQGSSLERIVPDGVRASDVTGGETLKLHMDRYIFAAKHISGNSILDIACGAGYGSYLLASRYPNAQVFGLDLSNSAITYARSRYQLPNLTFESGDAMRFEHVSRFSSIVSLETIEHLPDPSLFLTRLKTELMASDGIFVGSVPVTPSVDANPHHITDFSESSFRRLIANNHLIEIDQFEQVQPYNPFTVFRRSEDRMEGIRTNLAGYYLKNPQKLALRLKSLVLDGFQNKYLTLACRCEGAI